MSEKIQTLFFGNGINRLSSENISWNKLLNGVKETDFDDTDLPNTMIYERIILEKKRIKPNLLSDEYDIKKKIAIEMERIVPNELYKVLFNLPFNNYLTTNYDHAFKNSLDEDCDYFDIISFDYEDIYSLRRYKKILNNKQMNKYLWHIHGEINKPATIMLGLDHYCGSIGKIDSYIKGGYKHSINGDEIIEKSIEHKFNNNCFTNSSWIELFFNSDIHIIGFSLDFSEIDLWWILNKRSRMMKNSNLEDKINNKIIFYCTYIERQRKELLESMNVIVKIIILSDKENYNEYYSLFIKEVNNLTTAST